MHDLVAQQLAAPPAALRIEQIHERGAKARAATERQCNSPSYPPPRDSFEQVQQPGAQADTLDQQHAPIHDGPSCAAHWFIASIFLTSAAIGVPRCWQALT